MKTLVFIATILLFLNACDRQSNFEGGERMMTAPPSVTRPVAEAESADVATVSTNYMADRKLIKNGFLTIETRDMAKTRIEIGKICKEANAYLSSETQNNYPERLQTEYVVRVPAANFDALFAKIEGHGVSVETRNVQTTDVTEEFIDTEARLKTKRALEDRYHAILQKATKVTDMLAIEEELEQVRGEIERMEGRLKYLNSQVAYSTLTISCFQPLTAEIGYGHKLVASIVSGWNNLLGFVVGILALWPFFLLIGAIVFFVIRWTRARRGSVVS